MSLKSDWAGADSLQGTKFWCQRKDLSLYPFVASFTEISLKSDFIQFFSWFNTCIQSRGRGRQPPHKILLQSAQWLLRRCLKMLTDRRRTTDSYLYKLTNKAFGSGELIIQCGPVINLSNILYLFYLSASFINRCNYPKIKIMWFYWRVMGQKDADGMANSVDSNLVAPSGMV